MAKGKFMKIKLFLAIFLAVLTGRAAADEDHITGKWAADSRKSTGLGGYLLIFGDDGSVTNIFGALVDFKYQVEGHTLKMTFTDGASGKSEQKLEPFEIAGDKLIRNPADPTNRVEMTRVGTARPGVSAIVGLWTYKYSKKSDILATMQYTTNGLAQLSVPILPLKGIYKLQTNELTVQFDGKPPSKTKILLSGDHLTLLADDNEGEERFTRVSP
jgi:hypothetical protein